MRLRVFVVVLMFVLMVNVTGLADIFVNVEPDPNKVTIGSFASFGVYPADSYLNITGNTIDAVLKFNYPDSLTLTPKHETAGFSWFPGDLLFYVGTNMYGIPLVDHDFTVKDPLPSAPHALTAFKVYQTTSFLTAEDLLSGLGFVADVDYRGGNSVVWLGEGSSLLQGGGSLSATGVPGNGNPFTVHITGTLPQDFADKVAANGFTAYFASTECANGYMKTEQDPGGEVPEPASLALFGTGLFGLGMLRHRFPRAK